MFGFVWKYANKLEYVMKILNKYLQVMDTSLDKFYAKVFNNSRRIPEDILGVLLELTILSIFS